MAEPLKTTYLANYIKPAFSIPKAELYFNLHEDETWIKSTLWLQRLEPQVPLFLDGQQLELLEIKLDDEVLAKDRYILSDEGISINDFPQAGTLEITTRICPQENKALSGLYKSNNLYCTQCEAQGFRRITYFMDRPDVLTCYKTTIESEKSLYPILLSNGNPSHKEDCGQGRHRIAWEDPIPKPCYLFALVAGNLDCLEDYFITQSKRKVNLKIFIEPGKLKQSHYAMQCLKESMAWDEIRFGREYDLDIFMVVAVSDFNMGAMENKGLNIFNDACILADDKTATDMDFYFIQAVIGHEYFHNWTGNRVTCRDWFQLSLKEGLTIFREQEFTADHHSPGVKRIQDANLIRSVQFPEDAGPMAHPVRPKEYIEMNNFYTITVYDKGSEIIRMMSSKIGRDGFRKGMDLYFQRNDGKAVTIEDFIQALSDGSGEDLQDYLQWYNQAGTPTLTIGEAYCEKSQTYELTFQQSFSKPHENNEPVPIPVKFSLFGEDGKKLTLSNGIAIQDGDYLFELKQKSQSLCLKNIAKKPIPSLLRQFSAPVNLQFDYSDEQDKVLIMFDNDPYNRWDAMQRLCARQILNLIKLYQAGGPLNMPQSLLDVVGHLLNAENNDSWLLSELLTLPKEAYVAQSMAVINPDALHAVYDFVQKNLGLEFSEVWEQQVNLMQGSSNFSSKLMGQRALKNRALTYLSYAGQREKALQQFHNSANLTDQYGALLALNHCRTSERDIALRVFQEIHQGHDLVLDKYLNLEASCTQGDTLGSIKALYEEQGFQRQNPNRVKALLMPFTRNLVQFHRADGQSYEFLAQVVLNSDDFNPQLAARLMQGFLDWYRYDEQRQQAMKKQLERILLQKDLSPDVYEIGSKALNFSS